MRNLRLSLFFFLTFIFIPVSAPGQQKFEPTANSRRLAISKGQITEFLAAMEAMGLEEERKERWASASSAYSEASYTASTMDQLQKAISHGTKALELAQKAKEPRLEATAMGWLARAYEKLGQLHTERDWLKKAIEATKKMQAAVNKEVLSARLYRLLGDNYLRQRETKEAIEYVTYSLQVLESLVADRRVSRRTAAEGQLHISAGLRALGRAYLESDKPDEAIRSFQRGVAVLEASRVTSPSDTEIFLGLARAYVVKKDYPHAMENLAKALQMAEPRRQMSYTQQASSGMGDVYLRMDRPSEALPHYRKAIDSIESTRSLLESEEFRSSFFEDKGHIYGGMILAHLGKNDIEQAFNYNERARSRAFLDLLGSKVQLTTRGSLLEEERELQAKIGLLRARTRIGGEEDEGGEQIRQELDATQRIYADFLAKVRKVNKEQASLMNVEPLTLKQIQEMLEPGVTMLQYFVLRGRVILWVVEKDRVNFVRLSFDRSELISKVTALRESIHQVGQKEKFKQASEELYRALIEPALPHISGKELLIIPHDALHYLPYQALLSPQGKYLIQDYPVYYLSSASLMQFTREKRRAGGQRALVMGNPSLGDEAYNLRFAEREAKEVAVVYPQSAVYLKAEATKARAISLSPNYEMLHFAVHAELNENDPVSSALLLVGDGTDDGRLKVGEIFSLNLKAGMVVLSACETGLGKLNSGDEMVGMTRAFIYAGTPSIITTLWKVNDRASYELMREFYQYLKAGKKSEALRQAQLKVMKEFPEPFYWAAYGLTGEP